ncbi:galectin-3b [Epinephelus fuscoguttatus]|uniref:galectin-3b n=1 Tax=Epinephelus fuscoguttatus TaxID=293821 RepID=UPI0020D1F1FF|nr:galectin-3b [Epinephelus fuscoguttatus]
MDLSDALDGGNSSHPSWPGNPQPSHPSWPGNPQSNNPSWPGNPQSNNPSWPGPSGGGSAGGWPIGPSGGGNAGGWPGPLPGGVGPQPVGPSGGGNAGGWPVPSPGGVGPQPVGPVAQPSKPLVIPYSHPFPGGLHDKMLITIRGTVNHNPNKFTVDLHTDRNLAFHFNPRFNENGNKVIVRNSCIDKKWGQEERQLRHFPFVPGTAFELKILCSQKEFKVAVNNSHLLEFKHRITDLRSITHLCIHHDISLQGFKVETLP